MNTKIKYILKQLSEGKINVNRAIEEIRAVETMPQERVPRARKIKVHIVEKSEGTNIRIPGIPFWLINSMISLGFGLGSIVAKYVDNIDEEFKMLLETVNSKDIKEIIDELRKHGPFNMVEIKEGDNTEVSIRIL